MFDLQSLALPSAFKSKVRLMRQMKWPAEFISTIVKDDDYAAKKKRMNNQKKQDMKEVPVWTYSPKDSTPRTSKSLMKDLEDPSFFCSRDILEIVTAPSWSSANGAEDEHSLAGDDDVSLNPMGEDREAPSDFFQKLRH